MHEILTSHVSWAGALNGSCPLVLMSSSFFASPLPLLLSSETLQIMYVIALPVTCNPVFHSQSPITHISHPFVCLVSLI